MSIAWADLAPVGEPTFGGSISQCAAGGISSFQYYGFRVTAPTGLNGGYVVNIAGLGLFDSGLYDSRNHPGGSVSSELIEGIWFVNGNNSFCVTMEIGDAVANPTGPAGYQGLRIENAASNGPAYGIGISREWVYSPLGTPASQGISGPMDGSSWIPWTGGWYLSDLHWDGSAWGGGHIPAPGAALLGVIGLAVVSRLRRRLG
nr:hypothetical protein fc15 [uncultured bacterium]